MSALTYTLLADGGSDKVLMEVINWAIRRREIRIEKQNWADFQMVRAKVHGLSHRLKLALDLYPCDLLFVHRDAEAASLQDRLREIQEATDRLDHPYVPVIPIRMTEAWFLHDERAIRFVSGNPRGNVSLNLPSAKRVESLPNPKGILFNAFATASQASGRGLARLKSNKHQLRQTLASHMDDFSPLIGVPSFDHFLNGLDRVLTSPLFNLR